MLSLLGVSIADVGVRLGVTTPSFVANVLLGDITPVSGVFLGVTTIFSPVVFLVVTTLLSVFLVDTTVFLV